MKRKRRACYNNKQPHQTNKENSVNLLMPKISVKSGKEEGINAKTPGNDIVLVHGRCTHWNVGRTATGREERKIDLENH